jgi:hypothetical protein
MNHQKILAKYDAKTINMPPSQKALKSAGWVGTAVDGFAVVEGKRDKKRDKRPVWRYPRLRFVEGLSHLGCKLPPE